MLVKADIEASATKQSLEEDYQVVHRNERRIRVCIPRLASDSEYAQSLKQVIESLDFVTDVHLNPVAHSLAIEYETKGVKSRFIQDKILSTIQQASLSKTLMHLETDIHGSSFTGYGNQQDGSDSFPPLCVKYKIVHQNERRIRLCIPQLAEDKAYADHLKHLVESIDGVADVRINPAASSIAVEYDGFIREMAIATAQQKLFAAIQQATSTQSDRLPKTAQVQKSDHEINYWERLGLPAVSLGVALLAGPLELSLPFLLVGGLIGAASMPIFSRAIAGMTEERKYKVDLLDSLWIALHTLQGQYVAPALMVSLVEASEAMRDISTRTNKLQTLKLLDAEDKVAHCPSVSVADTQTGDAVKEIADRLVVPTLLLSSGIFALTGNISPALAPLQLDFGTGIGIAVPTTILSALTHAAHSGVFIRNGRVLEVLARIDTVVFGKTETLTQAIATVVDPQLESADVIATLTAQGIETYLLTADSQQAADAVATQLGIAIPNTYGSSLPEQKMEIVRKLHNQGKTVMYVGGELSDTEALASADVSVSLAQGTDIKEETADVILFGDLRGLIQAVDIAKQAMEIVHQNIAIVAVPNISVVIAGVFFGLHPVAAVLINNCTALIAEINGWRPQREKFHLVSSLNS